MILIEAGWIKHLCQNHPSLGLATPRRSAAHWDWDPLALPSSPSLVGLSLWCFIAFLCWLWGLLWISISTAWPLTTPTEVALETSSGWLGIILKSCGEGYPKMAGRGACWLSPKLLDTAVLSYWDTCFPCLHLCPCASHICVYTHVCVTCACVCFCVCVCPAHCRYRGEGDHMWDVDKSEEEVQVPTGQMGLDSVSSWCPCSRPECRNDGQW